VSLRCASVLFLTDDLLRPGPILLTVVSLQSSMAGLAMKEARPVALDVAPSMWVPGAMLTRESLCSEAIACCCCPCAAAGSKQAAEAPSSPCLATPESPPTYPGHGLFGLRRRSAKWQSLHDGRHTTSVVCFPVGVQPATAASSGGCHIGALQVGLASPLPKRCEK
jgi:hypothetical protein